MKSKTVFSVLISGLLIVLASIGQVGVFAQDTKTIQFWHFWSAPETQSIVNDLVQKYEEVHPGVKVVVKELSWAGGGEEEVRKAFASGQPPDVLELGSDMIVEYIVKNELLDLTSEVSKIKNKLLMWEPGTYNGSIYAIPWILDTRAMFYNRNLLRVAQLKTNAPSWMIDNRTLPGYTDIAGNPVQNLDTAPDFWPMMLTYLSTLYHEKPPKTWEDLKEACKNINDPEKEIYGFGVNGSDHLVLFKKVLPFIWSNGGSILSDDGKLCVIDSPENIKALEYYISLSECGKVGTQKELDQAFVDGKLGFWISGSWLIDRLRREVPNLDFGVALIPKPAADRGFQRSFVGGEYLAVSKKSKNLTESVALAKFITWEQNTIAFCDIAGKYFPSANITRDIADSRMAEKMFQQQIKTGVTPPAHPRWSEMRDILESAFAKAIKNEKTAKKALQEAKQEIDKILQQP